MAPLSGPRRWSQVLIIASLCGAIGCASDSTLAPPPPAPTLFNRIIFTSYDTLSCVFCNFGIWTTDTTGADLRLLLGHLNYPENATVSPDGRTVLYENWWTLYLVDAAGHNNHPLLTGLTRNVTPSWSPDGNWIYFEATDTSLYQIYRIHPDGTGRERVTSNVGIHERGPALSRDGRQLAYVAVDSFQVHEWAVIRDLASGVEQVLTDSTFSGLSPEWSPDASTLLFVGPDTSGVPTDAALWRLNTLTLAYTYVANAHGNRTARYSPDGRSLAYGTGDLWVADSDGQHPRLLLADSMLHFDVSWTPAPPP